MSRFDRSLALLFLGVLLAGSAIAQASRRAGDVRIVRLLNSTWKFLPEDKPNSESADVLDDQWQTVNVPHTWNAKDVDDDTPGYRRGVSWYRRDIELGADLANKRLYLYFEGVNQVADVYVNTHRVGKHIGGYSAFVYDITPHITLTKPNFFAVRVDNSWNKDIPPLSGDFNMYGGIYRDVFLIAVDETHFKIDDHASPGVQITTPDLTESSGKVRVRGTVVNKSLKPQKITVSSTVRNAQNRTITLASTTLDLASGAETSFDHTTPEIASPRLWSPDDPYLYSVENVISQNGKFIDLKSQPLGFRWFRFDAKTGFHLNGKPLKLRGTNRHQDFKGIGNALSNQHHVRDLELIKSSGYNFLRLAHYPQDPAVLEAADRLGLLLWEETPLVNYITNSRDFAFNSGVMVREMVRQHRNHPSVLLWGYMNEIFLPPSPLSEDTKLATVKLARELDAIIREEDPTRYTAIAFHGNEVYNEYDLGSVAQVVGWNLYNGWYGGVFDDFGKFMDDQHRRHPERVHIISEYGANGDQRLHSSAPRRFDSTTEWQRMFHESHWKQIDERPYIAGSAIWNEFDFGSEFRGETIPHLNQKGMWTFDRKPKDVHFFYKASFSDKPVAHIAVNDRPMFAGAPKTEFPIDVYSNFAEAELKLNGVSLGKKNVTDHKASWTTVFRNGRNTLSVIARTGNRSATDTAVIEFKEITVKSPEIAINVGSNAYFTDASNRVWLPDQAYKTGSWGFVGEKSKFIYSTPPDRNILGTLDDPLYQTMQEGLAAYKLDVPAGSYEVELLFAETKHSEAGKRIFDVLVNGALFIKGLDLAADVGRHKMHKKSYRFRTAGGLDIEFSPAIGEAVLSGLRVRRVGG